MPVAEGKLGLQRGFAAVLHYLKPFCKVDDFMIMISISIVASTSWFAYVLNLRQGIDVLKDGVTHNMLETTGFLYSLRQALRCKRGGLGLLAIPCNSFNWMSSSQHCRNYFEPWGDCSYDWVQDGNILASRSCLLILVLVARSCYWMTENPDRSQLANMPPLMHLMTISEMMPLRVYWWGPKIFFSSVQKAHQDPVKASYKDLYTCTRCHHVSAVVALAESTICWGTWDSTVGGLWSQSFPLAIREKLIYCLTNFIIIGGCDLQMLTCT